MAPGKTADPLKRSVKLSNYTYWQYREDLFDKSLTLDDILNRAGGKIPRPPRYPKCGEVWEYRSCLRHSEPGWMYPEDLKFDPVSNYWSFVFCGCLYFLHDGKGGS